MTTLVDAPPVTFGSTAFTLKVVHSVLDGARPEAAVDRPGPLIGEVDRAITRLQSLRLDLVRAADRARVAEAAGASGTAAWLATTTRADGAAASRDLKLATTLEQAAPQTRTALAEGEVSTEHARVIADTISALPEGLAPTETQAIESALLERSRHVDPSALRRAGRRALQAANRSRREVDAHEDRVLRGEEERALARTRLTLHDNRDGTVTGHFTVPSLAGGILRKIVQQMASPRRFAQRAAADARERAAAAGQALSTSEVAQAAWESFRTDDGDWAHRYGMAFLELLEHLPTDKLSGKVNATVVVTVDHDRLRDSLGGAHLDTGHDLSASQARRLACNAGILPLVLAGESLPLDLGRTARFFTEHQRVALATRYTECAADGCDRPYAWSELHHQDPWATGGATDLHLAVPLCGFHHRCAHDPKYATTLTTDDVGLKTVTFRLRT